MLSYNIERFRSKTQYIKHNTLMECIKLIPISKDNNINKININGIWRV